MIFNSDTMESRKKGNEPFRKIDWIESPDEANFFPTIEKSEIFIRMLCHGAFYVWKIDLSLFPRFDPIPKKGRIGRKFSRLKLC